MNSFIKKIKEEVIYTGFFNLKINHYQDAATKVHEYLCLESVADGVVILAETDCNQYVIIKEHRYPVNKEIYSLPGGRLDPKEPPIEGAKREFLEETGFEAMSWRLLGEYYPFPSVSDQKIWVFWAKGLKKTSEPQHDPLEQLSCSCLTLQEIFHLDPQEGKLDSTIPMALFFKSQLTEKN